MKKTSKKIVAGLLVASILVVSALPAFAAEPNTSLQVNYAQDTTYTLSIPTSIDLSSTEATTNQAVGLSAVNTAPDKKVQVKIVNTDKDNVTVTDETLTVELTRTDDKSTKVVSTVTGKGNAALGSTLVVAEYTGYAVSQDSVIDADNILLSGGQLNFSAVADSNGAETPVKAGRYTGTMVFVGAIENYSQV